MPRVGSVTIDHEKADQVAAAMMSLSPRQLEKIDEVIANSDPDLFAQSETFRAMAADANFSGERAFRPTVTDLGALANQAVEANGRPQTAAHRLTANRLPDQHRRLLE
jgi:hypothetical protein